MNQVSIRMYCMGTGDCLVLKFTGENQKKFLMMVDCGSCVGGAAEFRPYVEDLAKYVKKEGGLDLLIITHEHQDHVNGFQKCKEFFEDPAFKIREAWFAWTENPEDPGGRAKELQKKRNKMRMGFAKVLQTMKDRRTEIISNFNGDYSKPTVEKSHQAFVKGLETLAEINLQDAFAVTGESLAGMKIVKEILKKKRTKVRYLDPGEVRRPENASGLKFYILGPPYNRDAIFQEGKQGKDVYEKYLAIDQSVMSAESFNTISHDPTNGHDESRLPFDTRYIVDNVKANEATEQATISQSFQRDDNGKLVKVGYRNYVRSIIGEYGAASNTWRKIDHDWLSTAGSLALRLTSHINNTSLVVAIESEKSQKVLLLPGDAEFGSWQSWHLISKWNKKGKNQTHLTEDLLNRTAFYKVAHHLSYNGTALDKGIKMMPENGMVSMVTLDRTRISSKWKTTMPNKHLLKELIRRCEGKVFIMDEKEIKNAPSAFLDPSSLTKGEFVEYKNANGSALYKEYRLKL